jgi:integrase/recombinase XerC
MQDQRMWGEAIHAWAEAAKGANRSPGTIRLRTYYLTMFAAGCPVGPWDVTPYLVSGWLASHEWSAETRKSARASLRVFYAWAIRTERAVIDPTAATDTVRTPAGVPRPVAEAVLAAAIERATPRVRLMLLLAAYGGLRRAEIAGMHHGDIIDGVMRVHGKGGKVRTVPLHDRIEAELSTMRDGDGYLFPGKDHGHLSPGQVGRLMSTTLGPGWSAHPLRHRFGTRLYAGSRDILEAQTLLGHSSPATTQRYVAAPTDRMRASVNAIA